jgi:hypothetical protein
MSEFFFNFSLLNFKLNSANLLFPNTHANISPWPSEAKLLPDLRKNQKKKITANFPIGQFQLARSWSSFCCSTEKKVIWSNYKSTRCFTIALSPCPHL